MSPSTISVRSRPAASALRAASAASAHGGNDQQSDGRTLLGQEAAQQLAGDEAGKSGDQDRSRHGPLRTETVSRPTNLPRWQANRVCVARGRNVPARRYLAAAGTARYLSNQSATSTISSVIFGQPCAAPAFTLTLAGTPTSFNFPTINSACWMGTSLSASP